MYSWEIDQYLRDKDFHITHDDLDFIRNTSPQLSYIKFERLGKIYSEYTIGTYDNHNWILHILNKGQQ